MSTISPQESQYYKELVTPFQPMGRLLVGTDLRGTQCDRFGSGELRLVGYGDSSGGYAFSPKNQDAAIAPSINGANLSNIVNSLPHITEVQDFAGKWIDTITLHALDEFIEQTEPQSFIPNTLRIFSGGQKDFRGDGTGNRNARNTYTLIAEIPIPALTRADIPRSFTVRVGAYIPPSQNIYLGLAIPQPYTVSFELWDLQANTSIGSGFSSSIGGSGTVGNGNDLSDSLSDTPVDTQFVLPITFASATWVVGTGATGTQGGFGGNSGSPAPPPPTPPAPTPPPTTTPNAGSSSPSEDKDDSQPPSSSPSTPNSSSSNKSTPQNPPSSAGCTPIQDCQWRKVSVPSTVGKAQVNTGDYTGLCPKGTVSRGIVEFETAGTFILCCTDAAYPPQNLGCSGINKWKCAGGVCTEDPSGSYNSLIECQSALIPPNFTGGQCNVDYTLKGYLKRNSSAFGNQTFGYFSNPAESPVPLTVNYSPLSISPGFGGAVFISNGVGGGRMAFYNKNGVEQFSQGDISSSLLEPMTFTVVSLVRTDGNPDNCGNAPSTCP